MADKQFTDALKGLEYEFKSAVDRMDVTATERLNTAIEEVKSQMRDMERAANRPAITGAADPKLDEHKSAFNSYMRTGNAAPLGEFKAMSVGSSTDGGYTVPKIIDDQIMKALVDISPMRSLARVVSVSTPDFHMLYSNGGTVSGWVGETDTRSQTATSQLRDIVAPMGELFAWPAVTQQVLEDSQFDVAGYVASEVATEFARAEAAAFVNGNGTNMPKGFLAAPQAATADGTRPSGTVQTIATAGALALTADDLINLVYQLKAGYRANAKFVTNKALLGIVRSLKDAQGQYLWTVGLGGAPDQILGYDVVEAEDMPAPGTSATTMTANATPLAFGDFNRGYTIVDRVGTSMLYNPFVSAPYIVYQSRKRVGGITVDSSAFKLLKIKAS